MAGGAPQSRRLSIPPWDALSSAISAVRICLSGVAYYFPDMQALRVIVSGIFENDVKMIISHGVVKGNHACTPDGLKRGDRCWLLLCCDGGCLSWFPVDIDGFGGPAPRRLALLRRRLVVRLWLLLKISPKVGVFHYLTFSVQESGA